MINHGDARGALLAFMVSTVCMVCLGLAGCSSDRDRKDPTGPSTAQEFTDRGWDRFESGDFDGALADFASAIDLDDELADAFLGQGWSRLSNATDTAGMQNAVASFNAAVARGESGADVLGGRAAALLAVGGASLGNAVTDATAARNAEPAFVFEHRASFTFRDLFLIEAFARAAQTNFAAALAAGEQIADSGIEQAEPATWVVDAETFGSFEAAVLAFLHRLSEEHAG